MAEYTRDALEAAARESNGIYEVIRKLGGNPGSGGTHQHVRRKLIEFGIDTGHFVGLSANKNKAPANKKNLLVFDPNRKTRCKADRLRKALLELGRAPFCELCGQGEKWNGLPLTMEIDHKNGDWRDNRPRNLRFVCPNCHSQLPP